MEGLKAIFTVIIGGYDDVPAKPVYSGWDCFLLTDSKPADAKGWNVILVDGNGDSKKLSRKYKIMSHNYLPAGYDLVCYMDANIELLKEPPSEPLRGIHRVSKSFHDEAVLILRAKKEDHSVVSRQLLYYKMAGLKGSSPVLQNGFFVRQHNPSMNKIHEAWWKHIEQFSYRDQLSLPAVLEEFKISLIGTIPHSQFQAYFRVAPFHKRADTYQKGTVHHITSARADKNIGKAINDIVKHIGEFDWVCLRDIDTIPLLHKEFIQQCQDIADNGQFDLISCITNRIGLERQLYKEKISDDFDLKRHVEIAQELYELHGSKVSPYVGTVAGVMMMFSKKIWQQVGGFDEGGIVNSQAQYFDYSFSKKVSSVKGRAGIADGIYIFHLYRMWSENPMRATNHLY
jgi:hypothetical protein